MRKLGAPPLPNKLTRVKPTVPGRKRRRLDIRDKSGLTLNQRRMIVALTRGVQFCITKHDGKIHTFPLQPELTKMRLSGIHRMEQLEYIVKGVDTPFYYYWVVAQKGREISSHLNLRGEIP